MNPEIIPSEVPIEEVWDKTPSGSHIEPVIQRLLKVVPTKSLEGLSRIVVTHKRDSMQFTTDMGFYHVSDNDTHAWVEIIVGNVKRCWPECLMHSRFFADLAFSEVLFHEIGHHVDVTSHRGLRSSEESADTFQKELQIKYFVGEYRHLTRVAMAVFAFLRLVKTLGRRKEVNLSRMLSNAAEKLKLRKPLDAARLLESCFEVIDNDGVGVSSGGLRKELVLTVQKAVECLITARFYDKAEQIIQRALGLRLCDGCDIIDYYVVLCLIGKGECDEARRKGLVGINKADNGMVALMIQALGENALHVSDFDTALYVYEKGVERFSGQPDQEDIVAGCLVYGVEAARGLGREDEAAKLLQKLHRMDNAPEWAIEFAQECEAGKAGIRSDREYWSKQTSACLRLDTQDTD